MKRAFFITVVLAVVLSGCATQKKCWKRFPPQVKDSISYVEKLRDTIINLPADSSMAQYLIECEQTNEGLMAKVTEYKMIAGKLLQAPSATVTGNILTATAFMPQQGVRVQYKEIHYSAVKSQVFVKITNQLTGLQNFLVWVGGGFLALLFLILILAGVLKLKRFFLIALIIAVSSVAFSQHGAKPGTYWRLDSTNQPFGRMLFPGTTVRVVSLPDTSLWLTLTDTVLKTQTLRDVFSNGEYYLDGGGDTSTWYHASGATWQKHSNDSLVLNSKIAFKSPIGYVNARSAAFPVTNYANIYLNGNAGSAQVYAGYNGGGGFDNSTVNQTLAPSVGAVSWLFSSGVGTYKYQMDKSGLYPTIYTAGDYQHLGTTLYPWNAIHTKRVSLPATDTTGIGSTANVGTMMYYNGHFYGLKPGSPPVWVQLDN